MPDPTPLRPGDPARVRDYELTARLGEGGQGTVFLGRAPSGMAVAVKLLRADLAEDEEALMRFVREVATAQRVAPFCTAQVIETGVDGHRPFIVSEYIDGPTLDAVVREEGPRQGSALHRLAIGTVTALVAIHQADIVHRDFKPANVLLGEDGPRVIDFGIARALDRTSTLTSMVVGTPAYMTPEQLAGDPPGPATDMFAWGCTMVFAATGAPPFGTDSLPAVFNRIMNLEPDLSALEEPLRGLVAQCLSKDPAARPSAGEVLMRLLGHAPAPAPPPTVLAEAAAVATTHTAPHPAPPAPEPPQPPADGTRQVPRHGNPSYPPLPQTEPAPPYAYAPQQPPGTWPPQPPAQPSFPQGTQPAFPSGPAVRQPAGPPFPHPGPPALPPYPGQAGQTLPGAAAPQGSGGRRGLLLVLAACAAVLLIGGGTFLVADLLQREGTGGSGPVAGGADGPGDTPTPVPSPSPSAPAVPEATTRLDLPGLDTVVHEHPDDPIKLGTYLVDQGKDVYVRETGKASFSKTTKYFRVGFADGRRRSVGIDTEYTSDGYATVSLNDLSTGATEQIRTVKTPMYVDFPVWSPDGTKVLLTLLQADGDKVKGIGFGVVDVTTLKWTAVRIRNTDVGEWSYFWRGDGAAVGTWAIKGSREHLRFYDLTGKTVQTLTSIGSPVDVSSYDVSPSGERIITYCEKKSDQICVWALADGTEQARVTFPTDQMIGWYDEEHLAGWRKQGDGYEAVVIDLQGTVVRTLATASAADYKKSYLHYTRD